MLLLFVALPPSPDKTQHARYDETTLLVFVFFFLPSSIPLPASIYLLLLRFSRRSHQHSSIRFEVGEEAWARSIVNATASLRVNKTAAYSFVIAATTIASITQPWRNPTGPDRAPSTPTPSSPRRSPSTEQTSRMTPVQAPARARRRDRPLRLARASKRVL